MNDNFTRQIKEQEAIDKLLKKMGDLTSIKMVNDKTLSYKDAFNQVMEENPDLAEQVRAYQQKVIRDKLDNMDPEQALMPEADFSEYMRYADSEIHNDIHKITKSISEREKIPYREALDKVTPKTLMEAGIYDRLVRNSFTSFSEELVMNGNIAPALRGIVTDFLYIFLKAGACQFSEGNKRKTAYALDVFKSFLRGLPGFHERALAVSKRNGISYKDALHEIST
jgi:hypothetical protein